MGMFSSKPKSERQKAERKLAKSGLPRSATGSVIYAATTPSGVRYLSQGFVLGRTADEPMARTREQRDRERSRPARPRRRSR